MGLEREHKWLVAAFPETAQLEEALAKEKVEMRPAATRKQHDTYFDTPERKLQGAGAALRVRRFGDEVLATYKGPGAVVGSLHAREETEVPFAEVPALPPTTWPQAVNVKLAALGVETGRLERVLDLHTTRSRYLLYGPDAPAPLAELSFDEVRAAQGERRVRFRELELEAHPDTPDADLTRLGAVMATLGLTPHQSDKLTHALELLGLS